MNAAQARLCVAAAIGGIAASVAAVTHSDDAGVCATYAEPGMGNVTVRIARGGSGEGLAVDLIGAEPRALDVFRCRKTKPAQWIEAFEVRLAGADSALPAIAGRYAFVADTLRFTPAYPLDPGVSYRVRANGIVDTTLHIAKASRGMRTEVTAVFPSVDVLPMNQLKLYVHFSSPMRAGEAAARTQIIDETDGREVTDAFYNAETELWNPSQTRLTLLFDPGRIKRGLRPNEEVGLPLRTGRRYRLVIDQAWRDANGDSLHHGFVKRFTVVAPDREAPRVAKWSITRPRAQTRDTLVVSFREPMDEALLERLLVVRDSAGVEVGGQSLIAAGEDCWLFVPATPWRAAKYVLDVGTDLEDLAGNNLRRLFDTDLRDHTSGALEKLDRVVLPIAIRPGVRDR